MKKINLYQQLRPLLAPFAKPYARIMQKRREQYETGQKSSYRPGCPCISVGNIAWGGTGKTPITGWLLEYAERHALKAVVLTRGYGGKPGPAPLVVSPETTPQQSGDEPLMLALRHPTATIIAFPKRSISARLAQSALSPDLFILDDGMQHLAVQRDINLVLLRPQDLDEEWNRVIPSGSWREGASALHSASAFLVKASEEEFLRLQANIHQRLGTYRVPVFSFAPEPCGLSRLFPETEEAPLVEPDIYQDRPYLLVSGVGNSEGVAKTAEIALGRPPVQHIAYGDHHSYSSTDIQALTKLSPIPLPVVCTAKDAVKLRAFRQEWGSNAVYVLETGVKFGPALFTDVPFADWIDERLSTLQVQNATDTNLP